MKIKTSIFNLILLLVFQILLTTQLVARDETAMSTKARSAVVDSLAVVLGKNYIFPKMAAKIVETLRSNEQKGHYAKKTQAGFAEQLTKDIQAVSDDLHFFVGVDPQWVADKRREDDPEVKKAMAEAELADLKRKNFGFEDVQLLEGNVGYINFTYFADPDVAHQAAATAMSFVEHADALIFDMRYNNGGYLEMAQLLMSYLFTTDEPQMLFNYYYIDDGQRIEKSDWVLPFVPGPRLPKKPVYILTSNTSFSSAEWFSYVLKNLDRATIIGQQTAGGAHPVDRKVVDSNFFIQVPIGEIKGPKYGKDFEGLGVTPDITVPAHKALAVAHRAALTQLAEANPEKKDSYEWYFPIIAARVEPVRLASDAIKALIGKYEGREILAEENTLYYTWGKNWRIRLVPLTGNLLMLEGVNDFRFKVMRADGQITGLERIYSNGNTQMHRRIN